MSYGEKIIQNILEENGIKYIPQATFKDCIFPDTGRRAKFDFYLPDYNCLIEYDGEQHFQCIEHFGGEGAFKLLQEHDKIKNNWCRQNNYVLIRIPFTAKDIISLKELLPLSSSFVYSSKNYDKEKPLDRYEFSLNEIAILLCVDKKYILNNLLKIQKKYEKEQEIKILCLNPTDPPFNYKFSFLLPGETYLSRDILKKEGAK